MSAGAPAWQRVSAQEAALLLMGEGYVYLDVRTEQEFALGHPGGAYNVPWLVEGELGREANPDFLRVVESTFAHDVKLVVGCHTGNRSQAASVQLTSEGFHVVELRAGYAGSRDPFGRVTERGWQAFALPTESESLPGHDYAALRARAEQG